MHCRQRNNGTVYLLEYQSFSQDAVPITLHVSTDGGATWSNRFVFQTARHGHGLTADPSTHVLWALFGDGGWLKWVIFAAATGVTALGLTVKWLWPARNLRRTGVPNGSLLAGGLLGLVGFFVVPVVGLIGLTLGRAASDGGAGCGRIPARRCTLSELVV